MGPFLFDREILRFGPKAWQANSLIACFVNQSSSASEKAER